MQWIGREMHNYPAVIREPTWKPCCVQVGVFQ